MSHILTNILIHCIFCTDGRGEIITPEVLAAIESHFLPAAKRMNIQFLVAGGHLGHVHLLFEVAPRRRIESVIDILKNASAESINACFASVPAFEWQKGYGAFSVGASEFETVARSIEHQENVHSKISFEEEYISIVRRNAIEYDVDELFS